LYVADCTWVEYSERIRSHIVVLPLGAVEPHGPHLPLSTDTIIAGQLARAVDDQLDGLVLPPIEYGQKTDPVRAGGAFPGVTNLRGSTLTGAVLDILGASYGSGGRRFLLLNAHIANVPVMHEAADMFLSVAPDAVVMAASWWDFASEQTRDQIATQTGVGRDEDHHAALVETSLLMHLSPSSVRADLIADDHPGEQRGRHLVVPLPRSWMTGLGIVYRARGASSEIGKRLFSEIVKNLVDAVKQDLG
jgi:creatinine amidohydrolase